MGSVQARYDDFCNHYEMGSSGSLSRAPTVSREERWGLSKSQIERDYKNGYVTEDEYKWCEEKGLLRKEYSLTS